MVRQRESGLAGGGWLGSVVSTVLADWESSCDCVVQSGLVLPTDI